ncbi:MAG: hypothetical protein J0L84_00395 [Verrucomicrobia bacterium]|nr:hypothetical protein [Verrucomicrobiota bacterium]
MSTERFNSLPPASVFLREIVARIQALHWDGEALFNRVELFDIADLNQAARKLVMNQDRICVVIYAGQQFLSEVSGKELHLRTEHSVVCLIADRCLKDRLEAQIGGPNNPGVHELQRLVVGAVSGVLLEPPFAVLCIPQGSDPVVIADEGGAMPGRAALELDLIVRGGEVQVPAGTVR